MCKALTFTTAASESGGTGSTAWPGCHLPNYPGWRCIPDTHRIDTPESMLKSAIGYLPRLAVT